MAMPGKKYILRAPILLALLSLACITQAQAREFVPFASDEGAAKAMSSATNPMEQFIQQQILLKRQKRKNRNHPRAQKPEPAREKKPVNKKPVNKKSPKKLSDKPAMPYKVVMIAGWRGQLTADLVAGDQIFRVKIGDRLRAHNSQILIVKAITEKSVMLAAGRRSFLLPMASAYAGK